MRALFIEKHGSPSVLNLREIAVPIAKNGEVSIQVKAAGLNFSDIMARQGIYPDAPKPPCVTGYEVAGVVDHSNYSGIVPGSRVMALTRFMGQAEVVCVPGEQVTRIPDEMSFAEAAAIPVNYLTAYHALFNIAHLSPGQKILIHMAAGGVGTAALQLCQSVANVEVFGTASVAKHSFIKNLGCQHAIDRHQDYVKAIKAITKGAGLDAVLDPLGGADWRRGYQLLKPMGILIAYGFANLSRGLTRNYGHILRQWLSVPKFSPLELMTSNKIVAGLNLGHLWQEQAMLKESLSRIIELYQAKKIAAQIFEVFAFKDAQKAHIVLQEGKNMGKIVLAW